MASAPIKGGLSQSSGSSNIVKALLTASEIVVIGNANPSGHNHSSSMSSNPPNGYTTDNTPGCEYEETSRTIPRSSADPYELYVLAQSLILPKHHSTSTSNYTTNANGHGEVQGDDIVDHFNNLKIESTYIHESTETDASLPSNVDLGHAVTDAESNKNEVLLSPIEIKIEEDETIDFPPPTPCCDSNGLDGTKVEELIKPVLANTTLQLIDSTMTFFHSVAMGQAQFTQCGNHQDGSSSQSASGTYIDSNTSKQADHSSSGSKVNSSSSGQQDGQGHDDDEEKKRPRKRKRGSNPTALSSEKKLACPYFKHSPGEHHQQGACSGPGFRDIHRLKAHLYRCHRQAIECPRCREKFTSDVDRTKHLARDDRCTLVGSDTSSHDRGFSEAQEKLLRRRATATKSDGENWNNIYKILFPKADLERMPSPFYEHEQTMPADEIEARETDAVIRDQERYRIELPLIIQNKLEEAIAEDVIKMEEKLKSLVLEIVRTAQDEYFDSVREACLSSAANQSGTPETARSGPIKSPPCVQNASPTSTQPTSSFPLNCMSTHDSGFTNLPLHFNPNSDSYTCSRPGESNVATVNSDSHSLDMGQTTGNDAPLALDFDFEFPTITVTPAFAFEAPAQDTLETIQLHAGHGFPLFQTPYEAFLANFPAW